MRDKPYTFEKRGSMWVSVRKDGKTLIAASTKEACESNTRHYYNVFCT